MHWANCPAQQASIYTGKEKVPTISYEVTVSHDRRILHVSMGNPGARNDRCVVKTDEFIQAIKSKAILYDDVTFQLYDAEGII